MVDFLVLQRDAGGKLVGAVSGTVRMKLEHDTYKKAIREGLILVERQEIESGAVELRVAVRDGPTGKVGSLTIPLSKLLR